jgi:hypothetical protein
MTTDFGRSAANGCSSPNSFKDLLRLPEERLAKLDIALVNLLCAEGLPGTANLDRALCLRRVDEMAQRVRARTLSAFPAFEQAPEKWDHSRGIFRIHVMIVTLQCEFRVRYNPAKLPVEVPLDDDDRFIHGIIQGQGGTCGSLPVLYAAVGRRLGYPLKLVCAAGKDRWKHGFVRWDEPAKEKRGRSLIRR